MTGQKTRWNVGKGDLLGGRYRVVDRIGSGGMGIVFEAVQEDLGRRVAIKVLHPSLVRERAAVERLRLEAAATAALGHPHIVQITDFDGGSVGTATQKATPPFLVMEFLVGRSLGEELSLSGFMAPDRVAFIASQVLDALGSAHDAKLIHRDLKPGNVFLLRLSGIADVVKVLDFGMAKLLETASIARLTHTGQLVGTPAFMAPEQARGDEVDPRTDIYGVGALMYCMLTGRAPFTEDDASVVVTALQTRDPFPLAQLRDDVDEEFIAVVEKAMAKSLDARFESAAQMRRALRPWLESMVRAGRAPAQSIDPERVSLVSLPPSGDVRSPSGGRGTPPSATPAANSAATARAGQKARRSRFAQITLVGALLAISTTAALLLGILLGVGWVHGCERPASEGEEGGAAPWLPSPPDGAAGAESAPPDGDHEQRHRAPTGINPQASSPEAATGNRADRRTSRPLASPSRGRRPVPPNPSQPASHSLRAKFVGVHTHGLYEVAWVQAEVRPLLDGISRCMAPIVGGAGLPNHEGSALPPLRVAVDGRGAVVSVTAGVAIDRGTMDCVSGTLRVLDLGPTADGRPGVLELFFAVGVVREEGP